MYDDRIIEWVVLTRGDRPDALARAVTSIERCGGRPVVIFNGAEGGAGTDAITIRSEVNLGIPGGRDLGVRSTKSDLVGFLDDDAELLGDWSGLIREVFDADDRLAVASLRIQDESGSSARRHVPRFGAGSALQSGPVATFLGGACVVRRSAYLDVGGYWPDLFYGHEELDLSWRLVDRGWSLRYLADATVFHPASEVSRHAEGWRRTGQNRVKVARRNLPRPLATVHTAGWLLLGLARAGSAASRREYWRGWQSAWREPVPRTPMSWRTVWHLARTGRPPIL